MDSPQASMTPLGRLELRGRWLATVLVALFTLVLFRDTAAAMVAIWIRSETYQHAFLVLPIAGWLAWRKRDAIRRTPLQPQPWLLVPMVLVGVVWLLGELAEVAAASQMALVTLLVMIVPAFHGWKLARVLAFPLLFLYFLVPFGEFAIPVLQEWTADVTVWALQVTGVPVYREGMQFLIPSGAWSVVAACSGLSYTIALLMVGTLFGYLNYATLRARALFVLAALLVSILANWVRAYTIVMIGHTTGSPLILGFEHTVYGWFLFGAIVMAFFMVAARWTVMPKPAPETAAAAEARHGLGDTALANPRSGAFGLVAIGMAAIITATHAWAWQLDQRATEVVPTIELPAALGDWRAEPATDLIAWTPGFLNPTTTSEKAYAKDGRIVHVWIAYYGRQSFDRKLVTTSHRVVSPDGETWRNLQTGLRKAQPGGPSFMSSVASQGAAPGLVRTASRRVWWGYWFDGRWLVRPSEVKLRQAIERLRGRDDEGAIVMMVTEMSDTADLVLEAFSATHLPTLEGLLTEASGTND